MQQQYKFMVDLTLVLKYLFSRFWDHFTPTAIWAKLTKRNPWNWLVNAEIAVMRIFPDSWYDQNDDIGLRIDQGPVPNYRDLPEHKSMPINFASTFDRSWFDPLP